MLDLGRLCMQVLITLTLNGLDSVVKTQDASSLGAEYLQNAIRDIQIKNAEQNLVSLIGNAQRTFSMPTVRRSESPITQMDSQRRVVNEGETFTQHKQRYQRYHLQQSQPQEFHQDNSIQTTPQMPDPPSLTKGELAALYEAALSAGNTIRLTGTNHGGGHGEDSVALQAAVHEIHEPYTSGHDSFSDALENGYYYYYYPLKSFLDGIAHDIPQKVHKENYRKPAAHAVHTHQHNVKVEPIKTVMEMTNKGNKALEPLFMAISGFIGMAVMFMFTMVLWPRLTNPVKKKKTRHLHPPVPNWSAMFTNFVDNYGCPACESNSTNSRLLNVLYHNKFTNS